MTSDPLPTCSTGCSVCLTPPPDANGEASADAPVLDAIADVLVDDATIERGADGEDGAVFTAMLDHFDRPDGALNSAGVTARIDDANHGLMQYGVARGELATTATTAMPIGWIAPREGAPGSRRWSQLVRRSMVKPCRRPKTPRTTRRSAAPVTLP